jgi:hypothetical protein
LHFERGLRNGERRYELLQMWIEPRQHLRGRLDGAPVQLPLSRRATEPRLFDDRSVRLELKRARVRKARQARG